MRAIRFELYGKTAFFKKPDVNVYAYFTYNHIHKVALFGLLGAVIGLGGYMQQYEENHPIGTKGKKQANRRRFPEFYEVFQQARVSIVPHGDRGYFTKKIQIFNNTVGYASQEEGNVLNVREQWLENPCWTIYVAEDGGIRQEVWERLADYLCNRKSVFMPYLGKNDHPAIIERAQVISLRPLTPDDDVRWIDSLFRSDGHITYDRYGVNRHNEPKSYFKEFMPVALHPEHNGYVFEPFVLTNQPIDSESLGNDDWAALFADEEKKRILYLI